jgi:hypothetical protein
MKRRTSRTAARARVKAQKAAGMKRPGGRSNYARKREWCAAHGVFGFQVLAPKPWKGAA